MNASAKATPKLSLQTTSSIRGDLRLPSTWRRDSQGQTSSGKTQLDFAALPPSPVANSNGSALPQRRATRTRSRWWCLRSSLLSWVNSYPQLCFLLVYVSCTYASGLYASTQLTDLLLRSVRVPEAIANAQHSYDSASLELRNASECVVETSLGRLIDVKAALMATCQKLDSVVQANADALDQFEDGVAACSTSFLNFLKASNSSLINSNVSDSNSNTSSSAASANPRTTQCFSNAFLEETSNATAKPDISREVLDQVRIVLLSQATHEASGALKQQFASVGGGDEGHRVDSASTIVNIVNAIFNSTLKSLDDRAQDALERLKTIQSVPGSDDNSGSDGLNLDGESASLTVADVVPGLRATEALRTLRDTLLKRLRIIFPSEPAVIDKILNTTAAEWSFLETQVQSLQNQTTGLQIELQRMMHATWSHVSSSSETTRAALLDAKLEVIASMNELNGQWRSVTQGMLASQIHVLDAVDEQIQSLSDAFQVSKTNGGLKMQSHTRALEIDDFPSDDAFAQRQLYLLQRRSELQDEQNGGGSSKNASSSQQTLGTGPTGVRIRELVSAGIEMLRFVRRLLYSADWGYACLKILEVVTELWTDSYSDMVSVDIRGISSIQNWTDAWQIFKCKHDFVSVCYFLVTQAGLLLQFFVEYIVWICVGVAGTGALVLWKREFLRVCGQETSDLHNDEELQSQQEATLVQSLLSTVLPIRGSAENPLVEIDAQSAFVGNLSQSESWRIANASERAWRNQTVTLKRLQTQQQTLMSLTRMYDNCASEQADETTTEVSGVGMSDSCVNLDATNFQTLQRFPSSASTPDQLSNNAIFTVSSFDHCFVAATADAMTLTNELQVHAMLDSQACALEKTLYLTVSSWWLFVVLWSANRFVAKMAVRACGLLWWRFLSANRLEFVGFCYEDGTIQASESLAKAVEEHLRDVRWAIALRVLGLALVIVCAAGIWYLVLNRML